MKKTIVAAALAAATLAVSAPAFAQEEDASAIKITGSVGLVSDYRFRGVSQTDKEMAIQGGITATHESGFYVGTWASNLSGWGTFGGSNTELDIFGGYAMDLGGATLDVGLTWYMYPGGSDNTDFAEPYVKLSTTVGPVSLLGGVAYAPKQEALGNFSNTPFSRGQKEDNLYLWTDASAGIPGTPFKVKAHLGYSDGNPGLGPNGTSLAPTGKYLDWLLGAEAAVGPLTLGVSYIDTDISKSESAYIRGENGGFQSSKNGSSIAGSTVVFSLSASF
jgi:uncharacterized protein (TIGR02001 family)